MAPNEEKGMENCEETTEILNESESSCGTQKRCIQEISHDEKEKLLEPVVNNLEVAEPCVEVISQKEIIETNEVAMSVDIASDFDQNQISKSKFPVDTSENMDIWNEIDAIIEQADNEEDMVVAESIIQEVQTAVINPDVPEKKRGVFFAKVKSNALLQSGLLNLQGASGFSQIVEPESASSAPTDALLLGTAINDDDNQAIDFYYKNGKIYKYAL